MVNVINVMMLITSVGFNLCWIYLYTSICRLLGRSTAKSFHFAEITPILSCEKSVFNLAQSFDRVYLCKKFQNLLLIKY